MKQKRKPVQRAGWYNPPGGLFSDTYQSLKNVLIFDAAILTHEFIYKLKEGGRRCLCAAPVREAAWKIFVECEVELQCHSLMLCL